MNKQSSNRKPGKKMLMPVLGALGFLVLVGVLSFVAHQLEEIEERLESRLAYQPPAAAPVAKGNGEPVFTSKHAHTIYVPIYSHVFAKGGTPVLMEATLSIRNTDPERSISITAIDYYDSKGKKIDEYIDGVLELGPLESSEVLVKGRDTRGGTGANFLVTWTAKEAVHRPIVQAVMVGNEGVLDISFLSNGQPLTSRINPVK